MVRIHPGSLIQIFSNYMSEGKRFGDIKQIWGVPGQSLEIGALEGKIEEPLIKPIEMLLDKGINPYSSSANKTYGNIAFVAIDIIDLKPVNIAIAKNEFNYKDNDSVVVIEMNDINHETLSSEITEFFVQKVKMFKKQN